MATILPFPRNPRSSSSPNKHAQPNKQIHLSQNPHLIKPSTFPTRITLENLDSQIDLAVSRVDREIARLAARTHPHSPPDPAA